MSEILTAFPGGKALRKDAGVPIFGLLSDSHGCLNTTQRAVTVLLDAGAQVLLHLGDVGSLEVIDALVVQGVETRLVFGNTDDEKEGMGRWACLIKENNEFIGWCGMVTLESGDVDLGFRFYRKNWGSGYATEAAKACLKYGFDEKGLTRITASALAKNKASIKVIEKLGMTFVKYFEVTEIEDEKEVVKEAVLYAIEKED